MSLLPDFPDLPLLVLPGYGGSGPAHWQSHWQALDPAIRRFAPPSWDAPKLEEWIAALNEAVAGFDHPCLLIAHSLACPLVAHWSQRPHAPVAGAFLVAPPDTSAPRFPVEAAEFKDAPDLSLGFPAMLLASRDDPYASLDHARERASRWGAEFVDAGTLGHINADSALGDWPQGRALLERFVVGI
ncbi:RBBP9/YdeN family alpha/beta hydrolase [Novosphingobium sp. 9]|uniref:RBBP9/YdeN family alpha/beta hydrolase n=1 Tax=Novosphingobium sp. 9 TaxID=2025349 RepID=UPI0021B5AAFD|nr:alpha/beta hydrolase [Novosphingobium sp. 9]